MPGAARRVLHPMPLLRDRSRSQLSVALWWTLCVFCTATFLVHFSLLQLSNMPLSPLKLDLAPTLAHYVNPYFWQRWNFFAPQPISHDVLLVARGRSRGQSAGREILTPWVSVTEPLVASVRGNRLTPLFLVEVALSNAVIEFENNLASDPQATFERGGLRYVRPQISATATSDPLDLSVMTRTAVATLELAYPGQVFTGVQLGLVHHEYPRFSERHSPEHGGPLPMTLIDWQTAAYVTPY